MQWKELESPQYDIEIWHKDGTYVADVSHILTSAINMTWTLNDVEDLSFTLDLVQFKQKCKKMGVDPKDVLTPYVHDIRVRRNGEYILGTQVVDLTVNIDNNSGATLDVKCTGFLNLFKDLYITADWDGYTYAEIARKLVEESQQPDNLIQNGTFDINTDGWTATNGRLEHRKIKAEAHSGQGNLRVVTVAGNEWASAQTRIHAPAGTKIKLDFWWNCRAGKTFALRERQIINRHENQRTIFQQTGTGTGWIHNTVEYQMIYDYAFLSVEAWVGEPGNYLWVDDIKITRIDDNPNLGVTIGEDTAIPTQSSGRQRAYSLQAVKEAITALTSLENDNFDFEFTPDRVFKTYKRKGVDKPDVVASYPGNISSLSVSRSASSLANKVTVMGSGIGDQRIEVTRENKASIQKYGVREKTITANNVTLRATLNEHALGELWDRKDPTNLPSIRIDDGSINPGNVQVGDKIMLKVENDSYIEDINGMYRVVKISATVGLEHQEGMSLTLEPEPVRPEPVMVRYIKSTVNGTSVDATNQWNEIQALQLVGNDLINIARGKTVGATSSFNASNQGSYAVDGDTASWAQTSGTGLQSLWVDLGKEYPIDYVKVWYRWQDKRRVNHNVLSVGRTLTRDNQPLEHILWDFRTGENPVQMEHGMISPWIQDIER